MFPVAKETRSERFSKQYISKWMFYFRKHWWNEDELFKWRWSFSSEGEDDLFALNQIKVKLQKSSLLMSKAKRSPPISGFLFLGNGRTHRSFCRRVFLSAPTKAAGIFRDSGPQVSYSWEDVERDDFINHTPKVGPVSKCNRTFFSFIKYLDNWKVPVNGNLFQLWISQRLIYPFRFRKILSGGLR